MNNPKNKQSLDYNHILKRILITAISIVFLIVVVFLVSIFIQNSHKFTIAFYNIPESVQETLQTQINIYFTKDTSKRVPEYQNFNSDISLSEISTKKYPLIICYTGKNLDAAQKKALSSSLFSNIPRTVRMTSIDTDQFYFLPLLIDHFELAVNTKKYSHMTETTSLSDLLSIAKKLTKNSSEPSIYCAGASDTQLLQFLGALQEAITGQIPQHNSVEALSDALSLLQQLRLTGVITDEWFNMTNKDISYFMQQKKIPFAFMPLSTHRTLSYNITKNYKAFFIPANTNVKTRTFTAPVISAFIPQTTNKKNTLFANKILGYLISPSEQVSLSNKTGLAPADANANTPDIEADDVRYWIAASSIPYPGFDKVAYTTKKERNQTAKLLRIELQK